jgi:ubiquinone/menaquinone biosynthesis C-methylase UbiE
MLRRAMTELLHSALYFGETRDHWWNHDFLALMAERLALDSPRRVLDVGCGVGHWGRCVAALLPPGSRVVGVDREPTWVESATQKARERGLESVLSYVQSSAEQLPFADGSFDMVTCQTVLIHVADPARVLAEMKRVLAPGGLLLLSEPNNMPNHVARFAHPAMDLARVMRALRFYMAIELGKARLGLGFNSLGESLPGLVHAAGFRDITAHQNDRCNLLVPPYAHPGERAQVEEEVAFARDGVCGWPRDEARRYYMAHGADGLGASPDEFEREYDFALELERERVAALERRELAHAGGGVHYLISAKKPG